MLPTLCDIVSHPAQHPPLLVDGALELIAIVLAPSPPDAARQIHAAVTPAALALLAGADDAEVLRSATAYLRTLVQVRACMRVCGWGGGGGAAVCVCLFGWVRVRGACSICGVDTPSCGPRPFPSLTRTQHAPHLTTHTRARAYTHAHPPPPRPPPPHTCAGGRRRSAGVGGRPPR